MPHATNRSERRGNRSGIRALAGVSLGWLGISMIADGVPTLLLPYRLTELGIEDATLLGVISLVALALAALVQPVAGRLSDIVGSARILAVGVFVCGIGLALLAGSTALPTTVAGVVLALLGVGVAQAAQQALLPDHVAGSSRGVASGAKNAFDVGGALVGFVVIGALLSGGSAPATAAVLFIALIAAVAAGLALLGRAALRRPRNAERTPAAGNAFAVDRRVHGRLLGIIAARFLFLLGIYVVGRFLFMFVAESGGLSPEEAAGVAGTVLVILASTTLAASVPAGWLADRVSRRAVIFGGALAGAAALAIFPWASSVGPMIAIGLVLAAGTAAFSTGSWAALVDEVSSSDRGRLLGLAQLGTAGAAAAAGAFGVVIDAGTTLVPGGGYAIAFGLAAVLAVAGGVLAWRTLSPNRAGWRGDATTATAGASLK